MTPQEFKKALDDLGLSQTSAGREFGYSRMQIYNFMNGKSEVPVLVELVMNILSSMDDDERKKWIDS